MREERLPRTELRCPCGRRWIWYGPEGEARFLARLWAREHKACGFVLKESSS